MSRSRRAASGQKQSSPSSQSSGPLNEWTDMIGRMGNSFMNQLAGDSEQSEASPESAGPNATPIAPEWLQGKVQVVRGTRGGTLVEAGGPQLKTMDPADVKGEHWSADLNGDLEGKVWEKLDDQRVQVFFPDVTPDTVKLYAKKHSRQIDLFADWSGGLQ